MKVVKKNEVRRWENSANCVAYEYPFGDEGINIARIEITGRYPDSGYVSNTECKEIAYVEKGEGVVTFKDGKTVQLAAGDAIFFELKDVYFWDGELTIIVPCAPAWYAQQHKFID